MKIVWGMVAALGGVLWLSGCASMSQEQCLVGDWGGKGYQDGLNGQRESRLEDHAKACAKVGVTPNVPAYFSAREEGLRTYCTWENGFRAGRSGSTYYGVCTPAQEREFLPAYQDGRIIHEAESALSNAESALRYAEARIRDRADKLDAKERELRQEGLSREERDRIRDRIREVREELGDARRDARRAEDELRIVERETRSVIRAVGGRYGIW